jgi:uncharacterized membrane protein
MRDSKLLIGLPWLALPLDIGIYWGFWKRIPDTLAVHFDSSGAPNGYMSKWTMVGFSTLILLFVLVQFTVRLLRVDEKARSIAGVVSYYVSVVVVTAVFIGLLRYNM